MEWCCSLELVFRGHVVVGLTNFGGLEMAVLGWVCLGIVAGER
jgi:hypothetical protein